jgi:succinoglycan biosynthesis protein ExoO
MLCGAKFVITPQPGYVWTLRTSGKSQTTVDYTAQIAMSASLAKRSDVADDGKLVALLHDRRQALGRLETLNGFRRAVQSGKRVQAIRLFVGHPFIAQQYAGRVIRKVARLIR